MSWQTTCVTWIRRPPPASSSSSSAAFSPRPDAGTGYSAKLLRLVEKNMIVDTLQCVDGNQKAAGEALGLKYTTFCAKLKRYGIRVIRHIGVHP